MRDENARPITLFIQIDQQIEVKIDNSARVKLIDSFFDGFLVSSHSVAAVYLSRRSGAQADDRRGCQGYGGQTADVTNKNGAKSRRRMLLWVGAAYLLSSSMRRIGISARLRTGSGKVISGSMFNSASYAFSNVFIFMNRHSPQKQLSVGPGMNVLRGISLRRRCNNPASVTTMISRADDSLQKVPIFSVEQTASASIRTA